MYQTMENFSKEAEKSNFRNLYLKMLSNNNRPFSPFSKAFKKNSFLQESNNGFLDCQVPHSDAKSPEENTFLRYLGCFSCDLDCTDFFFQDMKSLIIVLALASVSHGTERKFSVGKNTFLKDGKAFRYISGSLHYFRIPR